MPKLINRNHERFAQLVASGQCNSTAYTCIYKSRGKTAEVKASNLANSTDVALRIQEIRAEAAPDKRFLTLEQKREFLALVVNSPIGEVDENSPLCQSADFAESATGSSRKFRMPDKLKAIELDARLAGELRDSHEIDVVDRRASAIELQQRLDSATPLLQARLAKEAAK